MPGHFINYTSKKFFLRMTCSNHSLHSFKGHWLLMDAMGIGLCVAFIAFVRLPSLKVSTLLLSGLLLYDVFWVFFSKYIFSANVRNNTKRRHLAVNIILPADRMGETNLILQSPDFG